ncbi:MAG: hypothetical protein H6737_17790 [Alphaproteobacteria bacterium]|nr:hypothetical protein [Alphaproteobacteria bacterium]
MAFEIRERSDHDGMELVATPLFGTRLAMVVGLATLGVFGGAAMTGIPGIGVMVAAAGAALVFPLWALSGERTEVVVTTRDVRFGDQRVRIEDIEVAASGSGTVRITAAGRTFELGHDWPADSRAWLVDRLNTAMAQRAHQLETAGPERPPPEALQALRGE